MASFITCYILVKVRVSKKVPTYYAMLHQAKLQNLRNFV
jgi:hypothetical protein